MKLMESLASVFGPTSYPSIGVSSQKSRYSMEDSKLFDVNAARLAFYKDYDEMDTDIVELSSALDLYADFVTSSPSSHDDTYAVEIDNNELDFVSKHFVKLEDRLALKDRLWFMVRNVCKYGDAFYEIVSTPSGVVKLQYIPPNEVYLNYTKDGELNQDYPYIQKDKDFLKIIAAFTPQEMLHFKIGEDDYGVRHSVFANLRRAYKILRMLEDSLLITRIVRSGQRAVYKIDVTGMGEEEATDYIRKLRLLHKKKLYFDSSGKLKTELDPLAPMEDVFIPVRKNGVGGDYNVIGGEATIGEIRDVEHFHSKLFAGTKVPKAYLGFEGDVNSKATLVEQHISFTKVVRRFRQVVAIGLRKIYSIELMTKGISPDSFKWRITFPNIGSPDEAAVWALEGAKAQVMQAYAGLGINLPMDWVIKKMMLNLTPEESDELIERLKIAPEDQLMKATKASQGEPGKTPDSTTVAGMIAALGKNQGPPTQPGIMFPGIAGQRASAVDDLKARVVEDPRLRKVMDDVEKIILAKREGIAVRESY